MKTLKSLFGLCVVGAIIYVGWTIAPAILANYRLEAAMDEVSRAAAVQNPRRTDDQIRAAMMTEVRQLRIPLQPEQINIQQTGERGLGTEVIIWADYTVHFEIPIHPFDMDFHAASKNKQRIG